MSSSHLIYRQPLKALVMLAIIVVLGLIYFALTFVLGIPMWQSSEGNTFVLFWIATHHFFGGYIFAWQIPAHYFELWPFNKVKGRFRQGIASLIIGWLIGTAGVLAYYYFYHPNIADPVTNETVKILQFFNFIQTVIFFFAAWYFWFENAHPLAHKQPIQGGLMLASLWGFAAFLTWGTWHLAGPVPGSLIPPPGVYVTWIWYPAAIAQLIAFETWPIQEIKQPLKGLLGILMVTTFTVIYYTILMWLNMDPISFNANGLLFMIIWTFTMLFFTAGTNHAPFRKYKQPIKGFGCTFIGTVAAIIAYLVITNILKVPLTGVSVGSPFYNVVFSAFLLVDIFLVWQWVLLFTVGWWFAGYTLENLTAER